MCNLWIISTATHVKPQGCVRALCVCVVVVVLWGSSGLFAFLAFGHCSFGKMSLHSLSHTQTRNTHTQTRNTHRGRRTVSLPCFSLREAPLSEEKRERERDTDREREIFIFKKTNKYKQHTTLLFQATTWSSYSAPPPQFVGQPPPSGPSYSARRTPPSLVVLSPPLWIFRTPVPSSFQTSLVSLWFWS